ncbi:ABC transporter permease, partial [bacterium]
MNLKELIRVAWKSVLSNKLRSVLTMLGVIIGVAAVIVMVAISAGTEATIAEQINGLGSNLVFISSGMTRGGPGMGTQSSSSGLVYDDMDAIKEKINGVAGVSVDQQTTATIKYGTTTLEDVTLVGTTPDYPTVRDVSVATGRFFTTAEQEKTAKVVVLGANVATELFGEEDPVGLTITVSNTKLIVVGVLAPKGLSAGTDYDELIYTPITLVFEKFMPNQFARFMGDQVRQIIVSVDPKANMDNVIEQITLLLNKRHNLTADTST